MDKKKILIVEDESHMRMMLSLELETAGYEVHQAEDGQKGFQAATELKPDLIISDILMPNMDGNQLMKELRGSDFGKEIPFIVLTARGQMHDYFEVMEVDDFIIKPFDAEDLLARVKKALYRAREKQFKTKGIDISAGMKKKILILENDVFLGSKLEGMLTESGYEVYIANTIAEGVNHIMRLKPDAVILKVQLDGVGADKLIEIIKGISSLKKFSFIVCGEESAEEGRQSAFKAGASGFIRKTDDKESVVKAVREALSPPTAGLSAGIS